VLVHYWVMLHKLQFAWKLGILAERVVVACTRVREQADEYCFSLSHAAGLHSVMRLHRPSSWHVAGSIRPVTRRLEPSTTFGGDLLELCRI
jgi:hypothetical protein